MLITDEYIHPSIQDVTYSLKLIGYQVVRVRIVVFNVTFSNISVISWRSYLLVWGNRRKPPTCRKSLIIGYQVIYTRCAFMWIGFIGIYRHFDKVFCWIVIVWFVRKKSPDWYNRLTYETPMLWHLILAVKLCTTYSNLQIREIPGYHTCLRQNKNCFWPKLHLSMGYSP